MIYDVLFKAIIIILADLILLAFTGVDFVTIISSILEMTTNTHGVKRKGYKKYFKRIKGKYGDFIQVPNNKNVYDTLYNSSDILNEKYNNVVNEIIKNPYIEVYSLPNLKLNNNLFIPIDKKMNNNLIKKLNKKDLKYINLYAPVKYSSVNGIIDKVNESYNLLNNELKEFNKDLDTYTNRKQGRLNARKVIKNQNGDMKNILFDCVYNYNGEYVENNIIVITHKGIFVIELHNIGNSDDIISIAKDGTCKIRHRGDMFSTIIGDITASNNRRCAITQTLLNDKLKGMGYDITVIECVSVICMANDDVRIMNESENQIVCNISNLLKTIENYNGDELYNINENLKQNIKKILIKESLPLPKYNLVDRHDKIIALNENIKVGMNILYNYYYVVSEYYRLVVNSN